MKKKLKSAIKLEHLFDLNNPGNICSEYELISINGQKCTTRHRSCQTIHSTCSRTFVRRNGLCPNEKCIKLRIDQSNLQTYGCENAQQNKTIREKTKKTCLEKYGVECNLKSEFIRRKIKQTNLEKYGNENYVNVKAMKQTKLEKYGDENYTNAEKGIETKLKLYGNDKLPSRGIRVKLFGDPNLYRSTWEARFKIENPSFKYEREHGIKIQYFSEDGKKHFYIPDFYDGNKIVEIKGGHLMKEFFEYKMKALIEYCKENDKTYQILSTEWAKNFQKLPQEKIEYLVKYKKTPPNMVGF